MTRLQIAKKAALEGGKVLMRHLRGKVKAKSKGFHDIVTKADLESEKAILETLRKSFPSHNFSSEEAGAEDNGSDYTWIVDPLDGTVNFASNNPMFSISIALKFRGSIIMSVIYLPAFGEMFSAERGKGAKLNGKRIRVSGKRKLADSISSASAGMKTSEKIKAMGRITSSLMPKSRSVLVHGSTPLSLAFVACGRTDDYVTFKSDPYNMAAGYLLVKEAGGKVTDFKGREFSLDAKNLNVIASNGLVHGELLRLAKGWGFGRD